MTYFWVGWFTARRLRAVDAAKQTYLPEPLAIHVRYLTPSQTAIKSAVVLTTELLGLDVYLQAKSATRYAPQPYVKVASTQSEQ